jgi:hypothetical protein
MALSWGEESEGEGNQEGLAQALVSSGEQKESGWDSMESK